MQGGLGKVNALARCLFIIFNEKIQIKCFLRLSFKEYEVIIGKKEVTDRWSISGHCKPMDYASTLVVLNHRAKAFNHQDKERVKGGEWGKIQNSKFLG